MTDDTILSHAEALAEIKRLRARITEMEAAAAIATGKWASRVMDYAERDDQPATYTHDVPPNAPR